MDNNGVQKYYKEQRIMVRIKKKTEKNRQKNSRMDNNGVQIYKEQRLMGRRYKEQRKNGKKIKE